MKCNCPEVNSLIRSVIFPTCLLLSVLLNLCNSHIHAQTWNQLTKVVASDRDTTRFGYAVAISGDYAVIGTYQEVKDANGGNPLTNAGAAYVFTRTGCDWTFVQKIVASDRAAQDNFGYYVDIEGDFIFIGAMQEDEDESGNNFQSDAGSVYVFKNISGTWSQVQKLVASDRFENDNFGISLSVSGSYLVVGAYREDEDSVGMNTVLGAGSAYVFLNTNGTWAEVQKIHADVRAANDNFGLSVSIDGDYIVSGAYGDDEDEQEMNFLSNAGAAYVFKNTNGNWSQVQKIVNSDRAASDRFGQGVAINGDNVVCGAPNEDEDENGGNTLNAAGSAYIFQNQSNVWNQVKKIVPMDRAASDQFGTHLAISGDYILVSTYREDEDCAGGNTLTDAGSAYMFEKVSGVWSEFHKICRNDRDANDFFSFRVDISGSDALMGSHLDDEDEDDMNTLNNEGSAYFFRLGTCVTEIVSVQSGDWNDPDTWSCNCIPGATDDVSIVSPHSINVPDTAACDTLSIALGATLILNSLFENSGLVTISGTLVNNHTLSGAGDKLVASGGIMNTGGILSGSGELEIADGGTFAFTAPVENQFYITIRNHGTFNWNTGYYTNSACGALSTIINESDGEFNIGGNGIRFLSKTNLINYGLINITTDADVNINYGCSGDNGYFNNISPGVVNLVSGTLNLNGGGTHSGMFNNSATLVFDANMFLTTSGNVTGSGVFIIYDTTTINVPYTFASTSITNYGTITGSGNKVLPSGATMDSGGTLSGTGELEIADGATLSFTGGVENRFYITIRNHGTLNWNNGYYTNGDCMGMATIINEADGEFVMGGNGDRFLTRTNLINYGLITKTSAGSAVYINSGCASGNGYFDNISPGVVNVMEGTLWLNGNGMHSGVFNNSATLIFSANMTLSTSGNVTGSGVFIIEDTTTINVPYTFAATTITNNGTITGSGNKVLPSGVTMHSGGTLSGTGILEIQDGASLIFEALENRFSITIVNHGTIDWSAGYYTNGDCLGMANIINETDGEMVIGGFGARFLSKTNLTNYGLILKNSDAIIHINAGCGNGDGYFNNISPGVVHVTEGSLWLSGNGTHSGSFINNATLIFSANMAHTTDGNLTGTGLYIIEDTTTINIPYTFTMNELSVNGALIGMGQKTLASGSIMHINNTWNVDGEFAVLDGAVLNYQGIYLSNLIRNHGIVNWNSYNINACGTMSTFINETDGEFNIMAGGYFSRTDLINYGLISKSSNNQIFMNAGCGDDGTFENIAPGVVNILDGELHLHGDGEHSGIFNNSGLLDFNADHELTTADNIAGTGDIQVHDSLTINIPYTLPVAEIRVEGSVVGTGDKILPAGALLDLYNTWNVDGELTVQDGAVVNYQGYYLGDMIRNHGVVNWNLYNWNACGSPATFINETDGEFNIMAGGYFSKTNLINNGLITKSTNNQIFMNAGCGNDGTFDNIAPGVVNILNGELHLYGDGEHSGLFNNSGLLDFNADHELTTADNITGTGDIQVHDSLTISIPYTLPVAEIRVEGSVVGTGDKILPAGALLDLYNTWNVDGELTVQDGAVVNYQGYYLGEMIRNHGVVNWNLYNWNACGSLSTFINEADGEFNIMAGGYFTKTNLTNYGLIVKTGNGHTYMNGGCGDDGTFNNITPGIVNISNGILELKGDGTHSGTFNNNAQLILNADHLLTTGGNIAGTGDLYIYDTTTINIPYTFAIDSTTVFGVLAGTGDLSFPAGKVLNSAGVLNGDGNLNILDGATLNFVNGLYDYCHYNVHNHGIVNWSISTHFNACSPLSTFVNEAEGELIMGGMDTRYFANTDLINYGIISKNTTANIYINLDGICGGSVGSFEHIMPGELNIYTGMLYVY